LDSTSEKIGDTVRKPSIFDAMPHKPLSADYPAPKVEELRALWRKYPDDEALRRTVKEVERLRQVMERIHGDVMSIERA